MASKAGRGLLIVVEGLDRSGKSSQCQRLENHLRSNGRSVQYIKFPDRTTPTGQMINGYLTKQAQQDDHSIHLLFSANRWEAVRGMLEALRSGMILIVDRYSFSGAVYSAAKGNPDLSLEWAWYCEVGLPRPDLVIFLDISSADASKRGGYGEERYETEKMQSRVRTLFKDLFSRLPDLKLTKIDAGQPIDAVAREIASAFDTTASLVGVDDMMAKLPLLSN